MIRKTPILSIRKLAICSNELPKRCKSYSGSAYAESRGESSSSRSASTPGTTLGDTSPEDNFSPQDFNSSTLSSVSISELIRGIKNDMARLGIVVDGPD